MTCGIYKITNRINGHSYIGCSKNIEHRFSDHRNKPFTSKRKDDLDKVLYKAIRKYGINNFNFEIIEECKEEELKEREIYWIQYFNTYKDRQHYNETPGGDYQGENSHLVGEEHGMAILTENDVIFCRKCYEQGLTCKNVWKKYFQDKITYNGFFRMWSGKTWKHIMPEVFNAKRSRAKTWKECKTINEEWNKVKSNTSFRKFVNSKNCFVGYGTAWSMVHNPEFYKDK